MSEGAEVEDLIDGLIKALGIAPKLRKAAASAFCIIYNKGKIDASHQAIKTIMELGEGGTNAKTSTTRK